MMEPNAFSEEGKEGKTAAAAPFSARGTALLICAALLFLCCGRFVFATHFYVDAEAAINRPGTSFNWLEIGRFSFVAYRRLLLLSACNVFAESVLTLLFLFLSCVGLSGLLSDADGRGRGDALLTLAPLLFLIHPAMTDLLSFRFQGHGVLFGFLLLLLADRLLLDESAKGGRMRLLIGIVLSAFAFGMYQALANLQLALLAALYFLRTRHDEGGAEKRAAEQWRLFFRTAFFFLSSLLLYTVISKLFFSGSSYLSDMIRWGKDPVPQVLRNLKDYVKTVLLARGPMYPASFLLLLIGILVCLFLSVRTSRRAGEKKQALRLLPALSLLLLGASPFLLPLLLGDRLQHRTELTLPLACALIADVLIRMAGEGRKRRLSLLCLLVLSLYLQALPALRLMYTEEVVRTHDAQTAVRLTQALGEAPYEKPVVFLGCLGASGNPACFSYQEAQSYAAMSVYEFRTGFGEDSDYYNSAEITEYLRALGYDYRICTREDVQKAKESCADLPEWPAEGAVRDIGSCIVVRLQGDASVPPALR